MNKINIRKLFIILVCLTIFIVSSFLLLKYSYNFKDSYKYLYRKQLIWYLIGFIILIIIYFINIKYIYKLSIPIYIINIILLIIVLFTKEINGIKAWINFGFFSLQPSEIMKFSLALILSSYLYNNMYKTSFKGEIKRISIILILTLIPSILAFLEPDTGSVITYFLICLVFLLFSKIRIRWFVIAGIIILLVSTIFIFIYITNKDLFIKLFGTDFFYRFDRIKSFINKDAYQLENALINMSSSGIFGHKDNILYFPEAPTDFAFALFVSLYGLVGSTILISSLLIFDLVLLIIIKDEKSNKYKLLLISLFIVLLYSQIQNILMNLGLIPIVGIPLPFISYGGSSLIFYFIFLSLILKSLFKKTFI